MDREVVIEKLLKDVDSFCPLVGTFKDGRSAYDDHVNHERWTLNPLRDDHHCGSFSLNLDTGVWHDFADSLNGSGSIIDLYKNLSGKTVTDMFKEMNDSMTGEINIRDPDHVYTYYTEKGKYAFEIMRWDHPSGKTIRPAYRSSTGNRIFGIPKEFSEHRPLFHLNRILEQPEKTVMIVEGEKACLSAQSLFPDMIVTTWSGGANAYRKTDWKPLKGREIILWPDNDKPGKQAMKGIETILSPYNRAMHCLSVSDNSDYSYITGQTVSDNSDKWDAADLYEEIQGDRIKAKKILDIMLKKVKKKSTSEKKSTNNQSKRETAANLLISIIEESEYIELWKDQKQIPFITSTYERVRGNWSLYDDESIDSLLRFLWIQEKGRKTLTKETIKTVQSTLISITKYESEAHYISAMRVGGNRKEIFIDIGDSSWDVVHITGTGWEISSGFQNRVRFVRSDGFLSLPRPELEGELSILKEILNIPDNDTYVLVVGWIIGCFDPLGPYPGMIINGPQGSAKSSMTRILKDMTDPHQAGLRRTPTKEADISIAAQNSRVLAYDNLSGLSTSLSDLFCTISTGAILTTRKLYTNSSETMLYFKQPWIMNGIDDIATRGDLADRAIILDLPPIPETKRKTEQEIEDLLKEQKPKIFTAICNAIQTAIKNYNQINLNQSPRMKDFIQWVTAAEESLDVPGGLFLFAYQANKESYQDGIADHDSLICFIDSVLLSNRIYWKGTSSELYQELMGYVRSKNLPLSDYPKSPGGLTQALKRRMLILKRLGISIEDTRTDKTRCKVILRNK